MSQQATDAAEHGCLDTQTQYAASIEAGCNEMTNVDSAADKTLTLTEPCRAVHALLMGATGLQRRRLQ